MRRRRWHVELKAQAQPDGLQRLGEMVRFVIDRAVVHEDVDTARGERSNAERGHEMRDEREVMS